MITEANTEFLRQLFEEYIALCKRRLDLADASEEEQQLLDISLNAQRTSLNTILEYHAE